MNKSFIEDQLTQKGISNKKVLQAFGQIPREKFVPENLKYLAYEDEALPIGYKQTISQPYTAAFMTELLDPKETDTIFEIGTGSGYQAAILSKLCAKVYTMERIKELYERAKKQLSELKISNVEVICANGYKGLKKLAPFDGIIVTAGATEIPRELQNQLKDGGRLVIPVGTSDVKKMIRITRHGVDYEKEEFGYFTFVPLIK